MVTVSAKVVLSPTNKVPPTEVLLSTAKVPAIVVLSNEVVPATVKLSEMVTLSLTAK